MEQHNIDEIEEIFFDYDNLRMRMVTVLDNIDTGSAPPAAIELVLRIQTHLEEVDRDLSRLRQLAYQ